MVDAVVPSDAGRGRPTFTIRHATAKDSVSIRRLIESVGINPTGLRWPRFLVAVDGKDGVVGCGQLKEHAGGMLELASIAVQPEYRGWGVASAIIRRLLASVERPAYLMCRSGLVTMYKAFGFRRLPYDDMPRYFQRVVKLAGLAEYFAATGESLAVMKLD
jgi:N-acetylglutamate synthase-like GNAT family acetyltransferase